MSVQKGKMMAEGMRNNPAYVHPNAINEKKVRHWSHLIDSNSNYQIKSRSNSRKKFIQNNNGQTFNKNFEN